MVKALAYAVAGLAVFGAAADALTTSQTVLAIANGNITKPYKLSTLVGLASPFLGALAPAIDGANNTLFAPTDEAFNTALTKTLPALQAAGIAVNISDPNVITAILKYHVYKPFAAGQNLLPSYLDSTDPSKLTTQNPQVSFADYTNGVVIQDGLAPAAKVIDFITTDNGQLNVVDNVLLPPLCPSQTAVLGGADFAAIVQALTITNLTTTVDTLPNATLFIPTTKAFETAVAALAAAGFNVSDPAVVATVLTYHAVGAVAYSTQLPTGNSSVPSLLTLGGQVQQIPIVKGADGSVKVGTPPYQANVIKANVGTCNGVIHVIDGVLVPPALLVPVSTRTGSVTATGTVAPTTSGAAATTTAAPTTTSRPAAAGKNAVGLASVAAVVLAAVAAF